MYTDNIETSGRKCIHFMDSLANRKSWDLKHKNKHKKPGKINGKR